MEQWRSDPNPERRLDAALALAQEGQFDGLGEIVDGLASADNEIRMKAAYYCQRIGFAAAIEPLTRMAADDAMSDNRNQAICALVAIGRPAVVSALIAALDDEDGPRREDARAGLYRVVGKDVLRLFADEDGGGERDRGERGRVAAWWQATSARFDTGLVYSKGEPASPGAFILQLQATRTSLPDAILDALYDWTGQDFGHAPLPKVIVRWEEWWAEHAGRYDSGRRYFWSHPVPGA